MKFIKLIFSGLVTLALLSMAKAAQADVDVFVSVTNNTSAAVSLSGSGTDGSFLSGPITSVPANSNNLLVAQTNTAGDNEEGFVVYGGCTLSWSIQVPSEFVQVIASGGTNCSAVLIGSNFLLSPALVLVRLDIN